MKDTKIEWTDHTFNPWEGCTKVIPGCLNCYAETRNARWAGGTAPNWGKGAPRRRTSAANWKQPLKWNWVANPDNLGFRECRACGIRGGMLTGCHECGSLDLVPARPRVFCASLADWLDDDVPIEWLADMLVLIYATPHLDWLLLTKRPGNFFSRMTKVGRIAVEDAKPGPEGTKFANWLLNWSDYGKAHENVWIGTTVEDQVRADERIPQLLAIPAKVRFLSCEPLLGAVDLRSSNQRPGYGAGWTNPLEGCHPDLNGGRRGPSIDWVICGGESGQWARPMHPKDARSLRDQCAEAGVDFFFKQWGEWAPAGMAMTDGKWPNDEDYDCLNGMYRVGKKKAGRLLDGVEHSAFPA